MTNFNPYVNNQMYMQELQNMKDKIDNQMKNLQQNQMQMQPQPITQNFQITPQQNINELEGRFAENFEEVKNTFVSKTGLFAKKDFSTIWVKDTTGNIRTFNTEEVIELDEKDKEILELKQQLNELKEELLNGNESNNANVNEKITNTKSTRISNGKRSNSKQWQSTTNVTTND